MEDFCCESRAHYCSSNIYAPGRSNKFRYPVSNNILHNHIRLDPRQVDCPKLIFIWAFEIFARNSVAINTKK